MFKLILPPWALGVALGAALAMAVPAGDRQSRSEPITTAAPTGYGLCGRSGAFRTPSGEVTVCAPITASIVGQVAAILKPADRELVLTSDGGSLADAVALAELLRRRGVSVRARGFCLASCSAYVLAMVDRVVVDPDTVIAFQYTTAFIHDAIASSRSRRPEP